MRSTVPPHYTAWRIALVVAIVAAIVVCLWLVAGFVGLVGV